jgi:membrane protein
MRALSLVPLVINAVAIGVLYTVMPNRRAAALPIAAGALLAGIAWHIVQTTYVALQIGVANYNAIYGALAQLPVTLVWLYVSWVVVLAGAELAAVLEFGTEAASDAKVRRDAVALHLLVRAGDAFRSGGPAVEVRDVARELRVDVEVVQAAARELVSRGWLADVEGRPGRLILTRDPAQMALGEVVLPAAGERVPLRCDARVRRALAQGEDAYAHALATRRVADLLDDGEGVASRS